MDASSHHPRVAGFAIIALTLVAWRAGGTVLTFDIAGASSGSTIPQTYGDRVTAATMGNHSYGAAAGFTPDVVVDYIGKGSQPDVNFWATGYNQLVNVAEYEPDGAPGYQVRLTADPGVLVRLESFDVGNFGGQITIPAIRVLDHNGQALFSQTNYVLGASSGPHSSFTLTPALMDSSLTIDFDLTGLGGNSDNVGLDNVRFGQVPEPSCVLFLSCGMIWAARRRRRARRAWN